MISPPASLAPDAHRFNDGLGLAGCGRRQCVENPPPDHPRPSGDTWLHIEDRGPSDPRIASLSLVAPRRIDRYRRMVRPRVWRDGVLERKSSAACRAGGRARPGIQPGTASSLCGPGVSQRAISRKNPVPPHSARKEAKRRAQNRAPPQTANSRTWHDGGSSATCQNIGSEQRDLSPLKRQL